jgi:thiamine-phosphate pyrophosphorylase
MIRCLITDGTASHNEAAWLAHVACWMERGVDLIQIRERDLSARNLATLTRKVLALPNPQNTKILVNDRADVAIACGAHGVHLRDGSPGAEYFARPDFLVTVACHNIEQLPAILKADYVLLSPIFRGHSDEAVLGLKGLRGAALISPTPILALGGVTAGNELECFAAGAAGIAGIGYFSNGGA